MPLAGNTFNAAVQYCVNCSEVGGPAACRLRVTFKLVFSMRARRPLRCTQAALSRAPASQSWRALLGLGLQAAAAVEGAPRYCCSKCEPK